MIDVKLRPEIREMIGPSIYEFGRRQAFLVNLESAIAAEEYALAAAIDSCNLAAAETRATRRLALEFVRERTPEPAIDHGATTTAEAMILDRCRPVIGFKPKTTLEGELRTRFGSSHTAWREIDRIADPLRFLEVGSALLDQRDDFVSRCELTTDPDPRNHGALVRAVAA